MVAAVCLTLALIHLRIAFGDGLRTPHFFFAIAAITVAVISGFELSLLRTDDLAHYQTILRWAVVPIWIMVVSVAGFVWSFFGTGNKWLMLTGVGLNGLAQMANLIAPIPVVRQAIAIHQVETFGGVRFTVPTIVNGSWNIVELVSVVVIAVFVLDASIKLWRRGERRRAAIVGGGIIFFFFASRGHAILVEKGLVQTPYLVSFAFLGVIIAMGHELSADVLRAAKLTRELRESERRTDLAARAAALGFWTWDVTRNEIWATTNARAIFGVSADEKLDLPRFLNLVHPEHREAVQAALKKSLADGGEYEAQYRVPLQNGQMRWIAAHGRAEFDANRQPTVMSGVVVDITARRQSELELQQLHSQLSHAGRVSVMGQLSAALAHELNQPLGAILSNAEAAELFLNQNPPALGEVRDILADIRKDDERAGEVIRRMRALLRRQEMERQPLMVNALVEDVFRLLKGDAVSRRIDIVSDLAQNLPAVHGDRIHLQQVFLNLIINAMEAMTKHPSPKNLITLRTGLVKDGGIEILIADSGPGIESGNLPRLFEPFFTTKQNGMGMGLTICHRIVEAHAGRIWAENNPAGGAVFRITLPGAPA